MLRHRGVYTNRSAQSQKKKRSVMGNSVLIEKRVKLDRVKANDIKSSRKKNAKKRKISVENILKAYVEKPQSDVKVIT